MNKIEVGTFNLEGTIFIMKTKKERKLNEKMN